MGLMGFWEILFLILLLIALGVGAYGLYRWWRFKKMLSYTKELIGKRVDDLITLPKGVKGPIPINLPKKGEVVLYFYGPNCKLCPKQEEEIKKLPANLRVEKLDVRTKKGRGFAALFRVLVLPTVVVLKDREIVGYFTLFTGRDKILKALTGEKKGN